MKFLRSTHDANGNYRGIKDPLLTEGWIVHLLSSTRSMSFQELYETYEQYTKDFPEDYIDGIIETKEQIAYSLVHCIECGIVSVI